MGEAAKTAAPRPRERGARSRASQACRSRAVLRSRTLRFSTSHRDRSTRSSAAA